MTRYRRRTRQPDLPPILRAWEAGEPPPDMDRLTPDENEQRLCAIFFRAWEGVPLRDWHTHPRSAEWVRWNPETLK